MALAAIFWASLFVALSGAIMPGPVLMVTVARTAARGFAAAPRVVLGHAILELGVVVGLFWGLRSALQLSAVRGVIGVVGGGMLLWMGFGLLTAARQGKLSLNSAHASPGTAGGAGRDIALGALASASNPYWILWWATVGVGFSVTALERGMAGLTVFYLGHISGDLAWYAAMGALVAAGRRSISERVYRGFLVVCSLFLTGLAVFFLTSGVRWLAGA